MCTKVTMEIPQEASRELDRLADTLGWPREAALLYAVRLVNACFREGLIDDTPPGAWPREAQSLYGTGTGGKVIAFSTYAAQKNKGD